MGRAKGVRGMDENVLLRLHEQSALPFRTIPVNVGVHRGSALSSLLFSFFMDTAARDLHFPHPWTLLYANDVVIAAHRRKGLKELLCDRQHADIGSPVVGIVYW